MEGKRGVVGIMVLWADIITRSDRMCTQLYYTLGSMH